ncbi:MFS transporter [Coxiella endosymbiont of Amblyomma nuttalli]|uniref:MFS transporter n=1 Tax=Coxiella endosymbiont of Amblyomma nuttalli TaxID=2749996 RepID=UPI001BA8640A|nr:Glycerol-3-phosphate transporter [Coxiella endosymbiont of Amblyomma nuttalli]
MGDQGCCNENGVLLQHSDNAVKSSKQRGELIAWIIFFSGVSCYCFAYLLRVYPSVMEYELSSYFDITAGGFGLLTSFYYFAYAPMQLPVGVILDRVGPRRSLSTALMISTLGVFIFAYSKLFDIALIGRFMVGFGASFAYVTALKLASTWLPRKYFATATGVVTGFGMVAAIFTDIFLTHGINTYGFRFAMYFPLFIGIILILLVFLIIRDKPKEEQMTDDEMVALNYRQLGDYLWGMMRNAQMWLTGIVGALLYLPSSVFLDLWAIPYLRCVHHLTRERAAWGASTMLMGWILSSFVSSALSDVFRTRRMPLLIGCLLATIVSSTILFWYGVSIYFLYPLLFIFGLCCGPHPLCFTLSKENNPHRVSGTAIAFTNFVIMMGGFVFQPIVGGILDCLWDGRLENGIRIYKAHHYIIALSIIPIGLFIASIITLFIKETYQRDH